MASTLLADGATAKPTRTEPAPCFACGHLHDPDSAGSCWEADCLPTCANH